MRLAISLVTIISITVMGFQLFRLYGQKSNLEKKLEAINSQIKPLVDENKNVLADINYFQNPNNLEKEARAQLNYVRPGEKMIIVIPQP